MSIGKEITELLKADVINQDTADRIQNYYKEREGASSNRLFIAFGLLGAILVGMGIILIIGHNWDELSRGVKTVLAFIPLLIGQGFCGFTLLRKQDSVAWRESTAAFLFFAVAASIALVSQIYNIPGDMSSFILTWMILSLPLVYLMRSSIVSLMYIMGITYFACETNYWDYPRVESYGYWLLLLGVLPHYYMLYKNKPNGNFIKFHHWFVPLSLMIVLGTVADNADELMWVAYMSLFGLYYLIGQLPYFNEQKVRNNGYKVIGTLGSMGLLLASSFYWFWDDIIKFNSNSTEGILSVELITCTVLSIAATIMLYVNQKDKAFKDFKPISIAYILFILAYSLGLFSPAVVVLINIYVLAIGVFTIKEGGEKNHLGILNFGMLIIAALITCRFFDTDMSFVWRGILFVIIGAGFFATNYWMMKKRRNNG